MAQKFLNGIDVSSTTVVNGSNLNSGSTVLDVQGSTGQLFSVTNSLTGDLFSVSDISGIPILNVNSSGLVDIDGKLGINNDSPAFGLDIDLDSVNDRINITASGAQKAIINGYGNIIAYGSLTSYNNSLGGGGGIFTYKGGTATQTMGHRFQHLSGSFTGSSGDQTMMQINPTINQTSSAGYTGIKLNVTETATGSGTKNLLDLQVGGTSKASISNAGAATFAGNVQTGHLGIGTAPTSRQLSVFRSTAGSIANFLHYTDSSTFQGLYIQVSQTTNDVILQSSGSSGGGFKFYSGNAEKAGIDASGNITLSGTVDGVDIAALAAANTGDQDLSAYITQTNADARYVLETGGSSSAMTGDLHIIAGAPKIYLQDNTDDDDQQIIFRNNSGSDEYKIATQDFTSGGGGDGFYIGSTTSDGELALVTANTTALTLDTSQNATFAGVLKGPDGSASAPTYSFSGRTDTGMYAADHGSNDRIWFTIDGSNRFYIDVNGANVVGNVYLNSGNSVRNYSGVWAGTTGTAGNGFYFLNTAGGNTTKAMELSSGGNATFAGTIGSGAITSTGKIQGTELEGTSLDINGNGDISGNLTVDGTTYGIYHAVVDDQYYFDDYNGSKNLNLFYKNTKSDILRYRQVDNYEYWNGSAWVADSSKLSSVKNLLDGRQDTSYSIPARDYKFRFTTSLATGWPTMAMIWMQTSWTGSTYPGGTMTVEHYTSGSWTTKVTADFTNANGVVNWGTAARADTALHDGQGSGTNTTRITIDFYGWTPSNSSYVTIPLQNLMITSNFSGTENTDYTNLLDYDRNVTIAGNLVMGAGKTVDGVDISALPTSFAPVTAEQNVQSDWNATSGDALILNKPSIPAAVTDYVSKANGGTFSGPISISDSAGAAWLSTMTNSANNGHGLLIQAGGTSGTRYITQWKDAAGTERFHMDDTGEAYFQNSITSSNFSGSSSGTNTGDQVTFDSTADLTSPSASTGTWTNGSATDWGTPKIGTSLARFNDGTGTLSFTVPTGMKTAYISQLTWSSGGYMDVYGVQSDGGEVFLRRINTKQTVENTNEGNPNQHDGSTIVFAGHIGDYPTIMLHNKVGRFHPTGLGFSKSEVGASEGTGMVNYSQLEGAPSIPSGNAIIDWTVAGAGTIHTDNYIENVVYSDFVSAANGGTFTGDLNVHSGAGTGALSVGRTADQAIKLHVNDTVNTIFAYQDSDGNSDHQFILRRDFQGTGASDFKIQNGSTSQLLINKDGQVTIPGNAIISGNLTVDGTTTTLNTQTVEVEDNIILLNKTASDGSATAATSGIAINRGGTTADASFIFDDADDFWDLTHNLKVAGNLSCGGYVEATSYLYVRNNIRLLNKAANGWLTFADRNTTASEAVYDLANIGTLTAAGEIEGGSLDINGDADISGTLTVGTISATNYGLASADIPNNAADTSGNATTATTAANAQLLDNIDSSSFLRSDAQDAYTPKRIDFGASSNWDSTPGFTVQTNLHLQGHNQFWIGAGNGTWFTGAANTKSSTAGLAADASAAHDLLITTMQGTASYDRGITFAVDNTGAGTSGYRLGKWHSSNEQHSSKLTVDGGLHVRGGDMANYDYYGDDYSSYWDNQGGQAYWGGDTDWIDPSITAGNAIQIQAGNLTTNTNNPALQFHQYGYGGIQFRYDGPNDVMHLESTGTNRFDYFQVTTDHGYFQMGAMNTSHVHLYTDRASFYSNKPILVNGTTLTGLQTSVSGSSGSCTGNAATASAVPWSGITSRPYIETNGTTSATATTAIASVAHATYTAAFFDFVIKNGTNVRAGTVYACHDGTNVEFTETSTVDLGDTSDVTLNVVISTSYLQLQATTTSSTWTIKSLIRAI